jgi:pyruvate kinase
MESSQQLSIAETISNVAVKAAYEMNARLIIVFTNSGQSAMTVQKFKPHCPILAVSASDKSAK